MRIVHSAGFRAFRSHALALSALVALRSFRPAVPLRSRHSQAPVEPKALHSYRSRGYHKAADPCAPLSTSSPAATGVRTTPFQRPVRWAASNELSSAIATSSMSTSKKAADSPSTPLQRKYGSFFAACMDTGSPTSSATSLSSLFARIDAIRDKEGHAAVAAVFLTQKPRPGIFFRFRVEQDQVDSSKQNRGRPSGWASPSLTATTTSQDDSAYAGIRDKYGALHRHRPQLTGRGRGPGEDRSRPRSSTSNRARQSATPARQTPATPKTATTHDLHRPSISSIQLRVGRLFQGHPCPRKSAT